MKKNLKKIILLALYVLTIPLAMQISFVIQSYIGLPLSDFIERTIRHYELVPIYIIFTSILSGLFIVFMIFFSRKIEKLFHSGLLFPITIIVLNIFLNSVSIIPVFAIQFSTISYYYTKYNTRTLYIAICILLVLLIADKKLYRKNKH